MRSRSADLVRILSLTLIASGLFPAATRADALPESAYIAGVNGHAQAYSLSCEARSAADWAAFWGVIFTEAEFLASLPRTDNPDTGFVGKSNDPWGYTPPYSYGVHAGPVATTLRGYGLQAEARRGLRWDDLRAEIATGRPVIVWVIGQMWQGSPRSYTASDGQTTTVAPFEHTMILIGYTAEQVHVVDAYSGRTQTYRLTTFLASWATLGNMAVTGGSQQPPDAPSSATERSYTVQPGEYLVMLAARFHTTWQALAELNDIPYPYTLFAGQVLRLPSAGAQAAAPSPTPTPATQNAATPTPAPPQAGGTYLVQRGEYLALIANRYGLDWRVLARLNGLYPPYTLFAGQVLQLPAEGAAPPPAMPETYIVQRGDYLTAVAQRFGLDWRTLAALNGIGYPYTLYAGQVLRLR